ncbi:MAG: glycosyltransferase [Planctomycetota bacterium]|jgi:glycosyltransferase involved in cell wall biosynthesis|nr:glycosyltransferase [Planctomycetota bacterium]
MNILWALPVMPSRTGAWFERRAFHFMHHMAQHHHVDVVCLVDGQASFPVELRDTCRSVRVWEVADDWRQHLARALLDSTADDNYIAAPRPSLTRWIRRHRHSWDAVVVSGHKLSDMPLSRNRPCVLDLWRLDADEAPVARMPTADTPGLTHRETTTKFIRASFQAIAEAMLVVAPSIHLHDAVAQRGLGECVHIPNGIDSDFWCRASDPTVETPDVVLDLGRSMARGEEAFRWFMTKVWPRVTSALPGVHLGVIGARAGRIGLAQRDQSVIDLGIPSNPAPYYSGATAVVIPWGSGGGMRNVALQVMASGGALVTPPTVVSGLVGVRDDHNMRFATDPIGMAGAVTGLLYDRGFAKGMGLEAQRMIQANYGWDSVAPQFTSAVADVAAVGQDSTVTVETEVETAVA